ncbi:MAG TPA: SBBP repeat-containing protein [Vicinamibacteria bacterium]|nr:SBBP repeat-containing protein [Vicinamibacteria bacterium]
MANTRGVLGFTLVLAMLPLAASASAPVARGPALVPCFEPNAGQAAPWARFLLRNRLGTSYFGPSEIVLASSAEGFVRVQFAGANPAPRIEASAALPGKVNYLLGNDPRRWRSGLSTYAGITYAQLYPGIDLAYTAEGRPLKGTYTVAPGADPARIRWRYEGAEARLDEAGRLHVVSGEGAVLSEDPPLAWQDVTGRRVPVSARYAFAPDGSVGFVLGAYDRRHALTIDPVITYSTFLGGSLFDIAWALAVDAAGNAYIAGHTASANFPTFQAYQPAAGGQGDAFVARFNPDGTLAYATYLGGDYLDYATDIAVDGQGNAYVTGMTGSTDFPILNAVQPTYGGGWDAFVTKLNPDGSALVYSTYLGGSDQENRINAGVPGSITVDATGAVYVAGDTQSTNFPVVSAFQPTLRGSIDGFVTKLSAAGSAIVYSTYLGGERGETVWDVAVDAGGSAVVTGDTTSLAFPTANAFQPQCANSFAGCWDVFVTRFTPAGNALVFSTYLGGNDQEYVDRGVGVAVDSMGSAYVTGMTGSPNFPIRDAYQAVYGGQVDAFVARFGPGGSLASSTFLGGSNSEVGYDIAVQPRPVVTTGSRALNLPLAVYVSGLTISSNFPVADPIQGSLGGFEDGFVARFTGNVSTLLFSTYLGGSNGREEYGLTGIGLDAAGNVYVAGGSEAGNYPVLNPHQAAPNGSYDAVITRIDTTRIAASERPLDEPDEPLP